ncbi:MAG: hypothetical protein V1837_04830 [Candidatus Woesearchaeota archaeon]
MANIENGKILGTGLNSNKVLCNKVVDQLYKLSAGISLNEEMLNDPTRERIESLRKLGFYTVQEGSIHLSEEYHSATSCLDYANRLMRVGLTPYILERRYSRTGSQFWIGITETVLESIIAGEIQPACRLEPKVAALHPEP